MAIVAPQAFELPVHRLPATAAGLDHSLLWNNTKTCYEQQLFGGITSLSFALDGRMLAAASASQLTLLRVPYHQGSIFNEQLPRACHSLRLRDDSALCVQTVERRVTVRSTGTNFERHFDGHTRDAKDALFLTKQVFVSCGDDASVRLWDMTHATELGVAERHTDYVRSLARIGDHVFLSGGYDKHVMVWDVRASTDDPVATARAAHSVECVRYHEGRCLAAVAAADVVQLFDMRRFGRAARASAAAASQEEPATVHKASHHTKAVAAVDFAPGRDALVTGGLDGRVKVMDLAQAGFPVVSSRTLQHPVTAVAVRPDCSEIAAGMATGHLQVVSLSEPTGQQKSGAPVAAAAASREAEVVEDRLLHVQRLLAKFQYHRALRVALYCRKPEVLISTLEELRRRCALHVAVSGHNDRTVVQLLRFAVDRVTDPEVHALCLATLDTIFDIYGTAASSSAFFHRELLRAHRRLGEASARLGAVQELSALLEYVAAE